MDDADYGRACAEVFLAAALRNRKKDPDSMPGESAKWCESCGEPIPDGRRMAVPGCRLCVTCQAQNEGVNH